MSGAVVDTGVRTYFSTKGENETIAAHRKIEAAQQKVQKSAVEATKAAKTETSAKKQAATATKALGTTMADAAADARKQRAELLESARAAEKLAREQDLATKEGRKASREQLTLAKGYRQSADAVEAQDRALDKATAASKKYSRESGRTAGANRRVGDSFKNAARWALATAAAYVSISQAKAAVDATNELAKATSGLNRNFNIGVKDASRWASVAVGRDIDTKSMVMSFTTLSRKLEDVKSGSETALAPFQALGVTQEDLIATGGDFQKVLLLLADSFGNLEGSQARQAAAQQLLGRGYQSILPMFSDGAKGLKEQFHWADKYGTTLTQKTLDAQMDLVNAQRESKVAWLGIQTTFAKGVTPAITLANQEVQKFAKILNDPRLTKDQKYDRIADQFDHIVTLISDRLPDVVERIAPQIAKSGGQLTIALVKGMARGFLQSSILAKVFTVATLIRVIGGRGALLAAGRALGGVLGLGTAQGMATGAAAGAASSGAKGGLAEGIAASMGGAAGAAGKSGLWSKVGGVVKGVGKVGLWGAAIGIGMDAVMSHVDKNSDNVIGRLQQIDAEGRGTLGTLSRAVGGGEGGIFGFLNHGGVSYRGDSAHQLLQIVDEINTAGKERAQQLREEADQLLENLDLTKKQEAAYRRMISPAGIRNRNASSGGIKLLNSGEITRARDIAMVVRKTQAQINSSWVKGSDAWRHQTARNMTAQVNAIRAGMRAGVISTRRGTEQITKIIRERKLLTGQDPVGIAAAYAKSWRKTHDITPRQINRMKQDLSKMPQAAREKAIYTMTQMAQGLVKSSKLPEKALINLRSALVAKFRTNGGIFSGVETSAKVSFERIGKTVKDGGKIASDSIRNLAQNTAQQTRKIRSSYTAVPAPVRTALHSIADYSNETAAAFGSSKTVSLAFRQGGVAKFQAGGVLSAVSSGEVLRFPNGRWAQVPGQRVAADNVITSLPPRTEVYTDHGQQLLAAGASRGQALDQQMPHFADGGKVPHGHLSGGNIFARIAGQKTIDRGVAAARTWIKKLNPIDPTSIVTVGRSLQRMGYEVGENPAFGGVQPVHAEGSYHYSGRAIDVNDDVNPRGGSEKASLDWLYPKLAKIPHVELLWQVADHFDHLHFAMRAGGRIPGFRNGGYSPGIWKGSRVDKKYPRSDGYSGASLPGYLIKAMAEYYGLPGLTMYQITKGESMGHPGVDISDPPGRSRGLYAINDHYNGQYGTDSLRNPIYNTWVAAQLAGAAGGPNSNIWHGSGYVTGWNLHYDADSEKIRRIAKRFGGLGYEPGGNTGPKTKQVTVTRDNLKPLTARQARRQMPRLTKGYQRDAFSTSFDSGRLNRSTVKSAIGSSRVRVTRSSKTVPIDKRTGGIAGYGLGGRVGLGRVPRPGGVSWAGMTQGGRDVSGWGLVPFGGRRDTATDIGGIGHGTGRQITKLFTAGNRDNKQVTSALSRLGKLLGNVRKYTVGSLVRLQGNLESVIRKTINPNGPGGRAVTKAEAAMIKRARATIDLVQGALGAKAGQRNKQAERLGRKSEQYRFTRDLKMRRRFIDADSVAGIKFEQQTLKGEHNYLVEKRKQQKKALAIARKAGNDKAIAQMKQAIHDTNSSIAENVVTQAEKAREAIRTAAQANVDRATFHTSIQNALYEKFQLGQQLAGTYDTGGAARADFINKNLIPALNKEAEKLVEQFNVLVKSGTVEEQNTKLLELLEKGNEIQSLQLEAQQAIEENTDPQALGGTLAFQFGGETLTDQLMLMGNGS